MNFGEILRKQTRISREFVKYSIFNDLIAVSLSNKYAINENSMAAILRKFHEHIFTWKMVPNVGHIHAYSTQQMLRYEYQYWQTFISTRAVSHLSTFHLPILPRKTRSY